MPHTPRHTLIWADCARPERQGSTPTGTKGSTMAGSTGETPRDRRARRAERGTAVTRRVAATLTVALLVSVPALGCAGSEEAPHRARPPRTPLAAPIQVPVPSVSVDPSGGQDAALWRAVGPRCRPHRSLHQRDRGRPGRSRSHRILCDHLRDRCRVSYRGGADDAAAAAEELAANLESLSTSGGEDARAARRRWGRAGAGAVRRYAVPVT